jgi:hypothetical protein
MSNEIRRNGFILKRYEGKYIIKSGRMNTKKGVTGNNLSFCGIMLFTSGRV